MSMLRQPGQCISRGRTNTGQVVASNSARHERSRSAGAIIVGYDGSAGARLAFAWALHEGGLRRRPVRLVYVVGVHRPGPLGGLSAGVHDRVRLRLELSRTAGDATGSGRFGVSVTSTVADGPVVDVLCNLSKDASLLVVGSDEVLGGIQASRYRVWTRLAAAAACSVVVVRGGMRIPDRRPVAVVEGTDSDAVAVTVAAREATTRGVDVVIWPRQSAGDPSAAGASGCQEYSAQLAIVGAAAGRLGEVGEDLLLVARCPVMVARPERFTAVIRPDGSRRIVPVGPS